MLRKIVAAAIIVLVGAAYSVPASAEPPRGRGWRGQHQQRGRSRSWRGQREYWHPGRGWGYDNPLGSIFGGILGGWLSQQMQPNDEEEDGPRSDRR
jgi:hypothetical protein